MKRDDRTRAMEALRHDPGCEVLLVSLKAGGVGLNLTAAQRVYLMDPYWYIFSGMSLRFILIALFRNPAVENQAVDRIVSTTKLEDCCEVNSQLASTGSNASRDNCEADN